MNSILVPINSPINASGLNGKIDYQKQDYISLESDLRQEYQIMEGVINDKIGMWDFIHGGRGSTTGTLTYGGGLDSLYPEYSILAFVNSHGGASGLSSQMEATMKAFDGMWWLNPYEGAKQSAAYRTSSVTYGDYETKMNTGLDNVLGVQALLIAVMQWGNPLVGGEAIQRNNNWIAQRAALQTGLDGAEQSAINLKNLQAELNYYTDISSSAQLKSVLLGTGNEEGKYTLSTGLLASDMDYLTGTGTFANGTMTWNGGKEPLDMNKIAGKNGNPVVQERYVHDAYGLLVRDNGKNAGGTSATITGSSSGIKTATMTSADEFVSALAVLSQSQYEIERDEYFAAQEKYVGPGGQKADQKVILDAREQFYSDLLKKLSNSNGDNVEYDMYKKVVSDYMGQGAIIDQLFTLEQQQQYKQQTAVWDQKEEEFYKRKQEWVENIQFLQNAGLSKFNEMTNTILKGWDDWRTEFNKKAKDGEKQHLEQIATMITQKAAWEKEFISTYKDQTDTDKLAEAYRQIQGLIESYKKELPTNVGVELNANTILNKVLAGAPSKFDDNLINQGAYQDVQFFIDQVTTRKLDDSNIKQFQDLSKEMEERSQKLVVLQTLDGLYNIPKTYEEMIAAANKDLGKQLVQKVMQDGFLPVGDLLIRQTVGADGQPQQQILPNYTNYGYEGPKQLPKVKDAQGKEWDLTNYNGLTGEGGPSTAELLQMVKLATTVLDKDFKKTYDPINQENREEKITALDPVAMARVAQASQGAVRALLSDPRYLSASADNKKAMEQNAMNSGYLVGPTEGGVFGDWHFNQYYTTLKLKSKYDELEAKGKEVNSDGFSNAVGSFVSAYTQSFIYGAGYAAIVASGPWAIYLAPKIIEITQDTAERNKNLKSDTANFMHDNKDTIDAAAAIAAVVASPMSGGMSLVAFGAYKAAQGAYEGGILGTLAGAANIGNAFLQGVSWGALSYETSYSYKDGFGVSVGGGYKLADGLAIGGSIAYNAKSGDFNGSIGLQNRFDTSGRLTGNLGVSFNQDGFTGIDAGLGIGLGTKANGNYAGSLNLGLNYDNTNGFGQSAGISENTNKYLPQSSVDYNHSAWAGNTYSVTTPSVAGATGTLSYNDITRGYTSSINVNGATAITYDSISGQAQYNKGFFGDLGKAQALAMGGMTEEEYNDHVKKQAALRAESQGLWDKTTGFFGGLFSSDTSPETQASRAARDSAQRNLADDMMGGLMYRGAGIGEDESGGLPLKQTGPNTFVDNNGLKYFLVDGELVSETLRPDIALKEVGNTADSEAKFKAAIDKLDSDLVPMDKGLWDKFKDKLLEKVKDKLKDLLPDVLKPHAGTPELMYKFGSDLGSANSLSDLYRPILDDIKDLYQAAQAAAYDKNYLKMEELENKILALRSNKDPLLDLTETAYGLEKYKEFINKSYENEIKIAKSQIRSLEGVEAGLNINDRMTKDDLYRTLSTHLDGFTGYGDAKFIDKVSATNALLKATYQLENTYKTYKYLQANDKAMSDKLPKDYSGLKDESMDIVQGIVQNAYTNYLETLRKSRNTTMPDRYIMFNR
ncbi:hypothetical protein [Leptospira sarikeiensis]|uniref:hypothetical protein n=1 Tax=Leptospira sarikeiensis TaxID=2484943 RepID=UPI001FE4FC59|nr:hypothetical protein [Leptospira sarikeiensis]